MQEQIFRVGNLILTKIFVARKFSTNQFVAEYCVKNDLLQKKKKNNKCKRKTLMCELHYTENYRQCYIYIV